MSGMYRQEYQVERLGGEVEDQENSSAHPTSQDK